MVSTQTKVLLPAALIVLCAVVAEAQPSTSNARSRTAVIEAPRANKHCKKRKLFKKLFGKGKKKQQANATPPPPPPNNNGRGNPTPAPYTGGSHDVNMGLIDSIGNL